MDPYNTADRFMPRDYSPKPTVTFEMHRSFGNGLIPQHVKDWAISNLDDGDYLAQYRVADDAWGFATYVNDCGRMRIMRVASYPS
jgi:hypothetical protein